MFFTQTKLIYRQSSRFWSSYGKTSFWTRISTRNWPVNFPIMYLSMLLTALNAAIFFSVLLPFGFTMNSCMISSKQKSWKIWKYKRRCMEAYRMMNFWPCTHLNDCVPKMWPTSCTPLPLWIIQFVRSFWCMKILNADGKSLSLCHTFWYKVHTLCLCKEHMIKSCWTPFFLVECNGNYPKMDGKMPNDGCFVCIRAAKLSFRRESKVQLMATVFFERHSLSGRVRHFIIVCDCISWYLYGQYHLCRWKVLGLSEGMGRRGQHKRDCGW